MYKITIDENKNVIATQIRKLYQGENNADVLHFMCVPTFNGLSIRSDCTVVWSLYTDDKKKLVDSGRIDWDDTLTKGCLTADVKIALNATQINGRLRLCINFLSPQNDNLIAKTNEVALFINASPNTDNTLPNGTLTLMQQYQLDMATLKDETMTAVAVCKDTADEVRTTATAVETNAQTVADMQNDINAKHTEVENDRAEVAENTAVATASKEQALQALQDLLAMLGSDIATLVNGKIPMSQIPATATQEIYTVTSEEELTSLSAQRGDLAELIEEIEGVRTITKTWQCLGDATVLENWVVWGTSYAVQSGNATTAENAVNASMINNHRVVTMSVTEFETAVKDENTVYLVGDFE